MANNRRSTMLPTHVHSSQSPVNSSIAVKTRAHRKTKNGFHLYAIPHTNTSIIPPTESELLINIDKRFTNSFLLLANMLIIYEINDDVPSICYGMSIDTHCNQSHSLR